MARRRGMRYADNFLDEEIQAFIVNRYCNGDKDAKIRQALADWLGKDLKDIEEHIVRTEVQLARKNGLIHFQAEPEKSLSTRLEDAILKLPIRSKASKRRNSPQKPIIPHVEVVATTETTDIARRAANRIQAEIIAHFKIPGRDTLHIGFAGGLTPSLTAKALAELLATPDAWPDEIYRATPKKQLSFHSMVGNINSSNLEVDPNAFMIYLASINGHSEKSPFDLRFFRLPAPGIVTWGEYRRLANKDNGGGFGLIQDAVGRKDLIDIVIASCGHFKENCNTAFDYLKDVCEHSETLRTPWLETIAELTERNIIGDLMWWPIGSRGPFRMEHNLRVFTLLNVFDLVKIVNRVSYGKAENKRKVILLAGPCKGPLCRESKGELLAGILRMPRLPMTHLIVDSRSARDCIEILK